MTQHIRVAELSDWINSVFEVRSDIKVSGGFRGTLADAATPLELFELHGKYAHTVRILIPEHPIIQSGSASSIEPTAFTNNDGKWWTGWAPLFTAMNLVPPVIDPKRFASLLHEQRRLRFCCDTNALSRGVASWLLTVFEGCAELVTSAVVDREFAAWPVRHEDMWGARTPEKWAIRTQYRLGLRTTETPPNGVVIDRLSPEQGALMLAKLRDETAKRSPDADMLLIELARGLIRDQPRNARIVYLTGDRGNARAAANALGAENVLYASTDDKLARDMQGKVAVRGWWQPKGPLGTAIIPPIGRFLWDVLAACSFIVLESAGGKWSIESVEDVSRGVPSDWADPWVKIEQISAPHSTVVVPEITDSNPEISNNESIVPVETTNNQPVSDPSPNIEQVQQNTSVLTSTDWLLAPIQLEDYVTNSTGLRPTRDKFFEILWNKVKGNTQTLELPTGETANEVVRILAALGAISPSGEDGPRLTKFREKWMQNDLDWFHAELKRLPGYQTAINELQADEHFKAGERKRVQITMARTLGQVARNEQIGSGLYVGDASLSVSDFQSALYQWLSNVNDTLSTEQLCVLTGQHLKLTPARTEIALTRLWAMLPTLPFEGRTGGTADTNSTENVVELSSEGYHFRPVSPGTLTFGRSGPVRFIVRTS